jgi:hypothetical protein
MAERKSLTTRRGREAEAEKPARKDVEKALDEVKEKVEKRRRIPYDASPKTHQMLSAMRVNSETNVPVRAFIDEAIEDLFEKYRNGKGRYKVGDIERILGK